MRTSVFVSLAIIAFTSVAPATAQIEPAGSGQSAETAAPRVLVTGAVHTPGRVTLTASTMTVRDAIVAAGLLTVDAGEYVVVIHTTKPGATPERRTIALKDLEEGTVDVDVALYDGDVITVPEGERFYIAGYIRHPGAYRLWAGTTVSQAITLAGGLSDVGTVRNLKIHRVVKGKPVEVAAKPDDMILPGDEVKVPRRMF
jgi:polysaccharide export outer membrane protein